MANLLINLLLILLPFGPCESVSTNPVYDYCNVPQDLTEVPLSVTTYDPFGTEPGYQCADPCHLTATGVSIYEENVAACPMAWVKYGVTAKVDMGHLGVWNCYDNFGAAQYQNGLFWHHGYGHWVIPIDLAIDIDTEPAVHTVIWNWSVELPVPINKAVKYEKIFVPH